MLLTKFYLPELRPGRVPRPSLLARLEQSASAALVIVSAPAGFGKTSLVSEWVRSTSAPTAWVSLDASDNTPVAFWMAVTTALDALFPGVGRSSRELLSARQPPAPQALVSTLLNDLAREANAAQPAPSVLVLDDIHCITHPAIYEGLLFFVERLPAYLRLALVGRSDPPLPLGRLRAGGRMLEIRAADLRFTLDESQAFFNRVMGLPLTPAQVRQLAERTEGWVAGLQLAGLAMQSLAGETAGEPLAAFVEHFSGDDRYILDYLLEEVLGRLPQDTRRFLLQTAILDRLCGPLCDAVADLPAGSSQSVLERSERVNLFIIPLDNRRIWYRYHHLFADLLRHQLERQEPALPAVLHRRAASWLAAQSLLPEAIHHALQGQDFAAAAEWIETYGEQAIDRGEYETLIQWAEALPEGILYARPALLMRYAWALSYLGAVDRLEKPLAAAERLYRQQGRSERLADALHLRADLAAAFGDGEKAAALAREALHLLPEDDHHRRGMSWLYLGSAAFLQGDMVAARSAFERAKDLCEHGQNVTGRRLAALMLAQVHVAQGSLPAAAQLVEALQSQIGHLPVYEGQMAGVLLAMIWREWNRLDEAAALLRRILHGVEQTGQMIYFHIAYLHLATVLWDMGDPQGVQLALEGHARLADQIPDPQVKRLGTTLQAQLALLSGDIEAAERWEDAFPWETQAPPGFRSEYFHLARARLWVRQGEGEARQALSLLDALGSLAAQQGRSGSRGEIELLRALALAQTGDGLTAALDALEQALTLAQPGGYRRLFVDEGRPFFSLLAHLLRRPDLPADLRRYATELRALAAQGIVEWDPDALAANQSLIEPLTPRELEVLRLIQAGLSNQAIAGELYLTLNTVKVHVKKIFAKLNASSRTQAVCQAEALGLI